LTWPAAGFPAAGFLLGGTKSEIGMLESLEMLEFRGSAALQGRDKGSEMNAL
jgi:hypothetical protein